MSRLAALIAGVALAAPAPALAASEKIVLAAYGTGTTTCVITVNKTKMMFAGGEARYDFFGRTECSAAVQQTGQAWLTNEEPSLVVYGPLCSGVRTTCLSSGDANGWQYDSGQHPPDAMKYRVTLIAPIGQGWIAPPDQCSGSGSDNLDCTFTSDLQQDTLWDL